jgi:hypothetical protein
VSYSLGYGYDTDVIIIRRRIQSDLGHLSIGVRGRLSGIWMVYGIHSEL